MDEVSMFCLLISSVLEKKQTPEALKIHSFDLNRVRSELRKLETTDSQSALKKYDELCFNRIPEFTESENQLISKLTTK